MSEFAINHRPEWSSSDVVKMLSSFLLVQMFVFEAISNTNVAPDLKKHPVCSTPTVARKHLSVPR